MVYYYLGLFMPRVLEAHAANNLAGGYDFGHDFYPIWVTSRDCLRRGCDLYGPEMTSEIQRGLFGRVLDSRIPSDPPPDYRTFAYPAFTDLLFWPAARFPFATVRVVVVVLLAALTVMSVFLWANALAWRPGPLLLAAVALLVLCSYPVLEGLYAGQLGLLVGFLLAGSVYALQRGRLALAGIIMAVAAIKPQMTVLAAVYLLIWASYKWRDRARYCVGLTSAILVLSGTALLVWPHWVEAWLRVLFGYHAYAGGPLAGEIFGLGPHLGGTASLGTIALLVALALSWNKRKASPNSPEFWLTLGLLLCITTVALLPSQGFQDQVILLPGIFVVLYRWRELSFGWIRKALLATAGAVLLWPWLAASGLLVLRPLMTPQVFYSKAAFALPVRTAPVFPFVLFGVLALAFRHPSPRPPNS
jgi:hypothetical protein